MRPEQDETLMAEAIRLAKKGLGRTSPNPAVGAVITRNGRIISTGYHRRAGLPHAEADAISKSKCPLKGATLYVTLEPCCHYGRTPPCTKAITASGISRVVAAMEDPNPLVSGKGIAQLRRAGILVEVGVLRDKARELNRPFIRYMTTGMPFVTVKIAMTLDGKTATSSGESRWITSERARVYSHKLRAGADAVLVGIGTVLKDNPRLTARQPGKKEAYPARVIVDSRLRTPLEAKALDPPGRVIIATTGRASAKKRRALSERGAEIMDAGGRHGRVDLRKALRGLGRLGITSVLAEGGSEINGSLLSEGLADRLLLFISPSIMGGQGSISAFRGPGPKSLAGLNHVSIASIKRIGTDTLIDARPLRRQ